MIIEMANCVADAFYFHFASSMDSLAPRLGNRAWLAKSCQLTTQPMCIALLGLVCESELMCTLGS